MDYGLLEARIRGESVLMVLSSAAYGTEKKNAHLILANSRTIYHTYTQMVELSVSCKDAEDPNCWARYGTVVDLELDLELDRFRSDENNSRFVSHLDLDLQDFDTALGEMVDADSRGRKRKLSALDPAEDTATAVDEGPPPKRWFEGVERVARKVVGTFGFVV